MNPGVSERQRAITLAQARFKKQEAMERVSHSMQNCVKTTSEEEYNQFLQDGIKAAHDYNVWDTVVKTLVYCG